jgi:lysozyme
MATVVGDVMRHITDQGLELIKRFEGFSPTIYICPAGWPTIGFGHVVRELERDLYEAGIDEDAGAALLQHDVGVSERAVLRLIRVPLDDGQFDALVSFTFNLGAGALQRSTLRRKVNREAHGAAPAEFRRWVWAGGRKLGGLVRRRDAEVDRFIASD